MARDQRNERPEKKTSVPAAELSAPKPKDKKPKPLVHAAEPSLKLSTCTKVKVIHILCDTLEDINEAYKKLQRNWIRKGEGVPKKEFIDLAGKKPNKGGELEWFARKEKPDDNWLFEDVAFSTHAGAITAPFKSNKGYHIILVEERKI